MALLGAACQVIDDDGIDPTMSLTALYLSQIPAEEAESLISYAHMDFCQQERLVEQISAVSQTLECSSSSFDPPQLESEELQSHAFDDGTSLAALYISSLPDSEAALLLSAAPKHVQEHMSSQVNEIIRKREASLRFSFTIDSQAKDGATSSALQKVCDWDDGAQPREWKLPAVYDGNAPEAAAPIPLDGTAAAGASATLVEAEASFGAVIEEGGADGDPDDAGEFTVASCTGTVPPVAEHNTCEASAETSVSSGGAAARTEESSTAAAAAGMDAAAAAAAVAGTSRTTPQELSQAVNEMLQQLRQRYQERAGPGSVLAATTLTEQQQDEDMAEECAAPGDVTSHGSNVAAAAAAVAAPGADGSVVAATSKAATEDLFQKLPMVRVPQDEATAFMSSSSSATTDTDVEADAAGTDTTSDAGTDENTDMRLEAAAAAAGALAQVGTESTTEEETDSGNDADADADAVVVLEPEAGALSGLHARHAIPGRFATYAHLAQPPRQQHQPVARHASIPTLIVPQYSPMGTASAPATPLSADLLQAQQMLLGLKAELQAKSKAAGSSLPASPAFSTSLAAMEQGNIFKAPPAMATLSSVQSNSIESLMPGLPYAPQPGNFKDGVPPFMASRSSFVKTASMLNLQELTALQQPQRSVSFAGSNESPLTAQGSLSSQLQLTQQVLVDLQRQLQQQQKQQAVAAGEDVAGQVTAGSSWYGAMAAAVMDAERREIESQAAHGFERMAAMPNASPAQQQAMIASPDTSAAAPAGDAVFGEHPVLSKRSITLGRTSRTPDPPQDMEYRRLPRAVVSSVAVANGSPSSMQQLEEARRLLLELRTQMRMDSARARPAGILEEAAAASEEEAVAQAVASSSYEADAVVEAVSESSSSDTDRDGSDAHSLTVEVFEGETEPGDPAVGAESVTVAEASDAVSTNAENKVAAGLAIEPEAGHATLEPVPAALETVTDFAKALSGVKDETFVVMEVSESSLQSLPTPVKDAFNPDLAQYAAAESNAAVSSTSAVHGSPASPQQLEEAQLLLLGLRAQVRLKTTEDTPALVTDRVPGSASPDNMPPPAALAQLTLPTLAASDRAAAAAPGDPGPGSCMEAGSWPAAAPSPFSAPLAQATAAADASKPACPYAVEVTVAAAQQLLQELQEARQLDGSDAALVMKGQGPQQLSLPVVPTAVVPQGMDDMKEEHVPLDVRTGSASVEGWGQGVALTTARKPPHKEDSSASLSSMASMPAAAATAKADANVQQSSSTRETGGSFTFSSSRPSSFVISREITPFEAPRPLGLSATPLLPGSSSLGRPAALASLPILPTQRQAGGVAPSRFLSVAVLAKEVEALKMQLLREQAKAVLQGNLPTKPLEKAAPAAAAAATQHVAQQPGMAAAMQLPGNTSQQMAMQQGMPGAMSQAAVATTQYATGQSVSSLAEMARTLLNGSGSSQSQSSSMQAVAQGMQAATASPQVQLDRGPSYSVAPAAYGLMTSAAALQPFDQVALPGWQQQQQAAGTQGMAAMGQLWGSLQNNGILQPPAAPNHTWSSHAASQSQSGMQAPMHMPMQPPMQVPMHAPMQPPMVAAGVPQQVDLPARVAVRTSTSGAVRPWLPKDI